MTATTTTLSELDQLKKEYIDWNNDLRIDQLEPFFDIMSELKELDLRYGSEGFTEKDLEDAKERLTASYVVAIKGMTLYATNFVEPETLYLPWGGREQLVIDLLKEVGDSYTKIARAYANQVVNLLQYGYDSGPLAGREDIYSNVQSRLARISEEYGEESDLDCVKAGHKYFKQCAEVIGFDYDSILDFYKNQVVYLFSEARRLSVCAIEEITDGVAGTYILDIYLPRIETFDEEYPEVAKFAAMK